MLVADKWTDYSLIDASDGSKLEKWGDFYLSRPDPQAIWSYKTGEELWKKIVENFLILIYRILWLNQTIKLFYLLG